MFWLSDLKNLHSSEFESIVHVLVKKIPQISKNCGHVTGAMYKYAFYMKPTSRL